MERLKRGDVVLVVAPGSYGKPRPAVIVQTDLANETHPSFVVCPLTSHLRDAPLFRPDVDPDRENGLAKPSQIMVDKIITLPREKVKEVVGRLDEDKVDPIVKTVFLKY
ncbi:MAG: type II toxin-antitoxin system PemK/MazF family toxin [Thermodesulfobacteriota bacterium]